MLGHVGLEPGEGGGGLAVHLAAPPQALVPPRARHGLLGEDVHTLQTQGGVILDLDNW